MKSKELIPVLIKSKKQDVRKSVGFILMLEDYSFSYNGDKCQFTLEVSDYMHLLSFLRSYGFEDGYPEIIVNGIPVNEFGEELQ